jgi:hypothetical protein
MNFYLVTLRAQSSCVQELCCGLHFRHPVSTLTDKALYKPPLTTHFMFRNKQNVSAAAAAAAI